MSDVIKNTLSQLADYKNEAADIIARADGELNEASEAYWMEVENSLADKVDKYFGQSQEFDAQASYYEELAKAAAAKAKTIRNLEKRMKETVKFVMAKLQVTELSGQVYGYKLSKSKPKLVVDVNEVPPEYHMLVVPASYSTPDLERVRTALEKGDEVPGAKLEPVFALRSGLSKKPKLSRGKG